MNIGIIAEGRGDLAVITNLLKGWLNVDDVTYIRPELNLDETDLHGFSEEQYSNWEIVKQECINYSRIDYFLNSPIDEERLVVIHIDAAECELPNYGVQRPPTPRGADHASELYARIAAKLKEWLSGRGDGRLRYAIAVEETDAWLLTLFSRRETSTHPNAKEALQRELNRSNLFSARDRRRLSQLKTYAYYDELSQPFRRRRNLEESIGRNKSLRLFLESLER